MKRLTSFLLLCWLFINLISGQVSADTHIQDEETTPTATPAPILAVTSFSVFPETIVAGDPFKVTVGLQNNHTGPIGYLSSTITDISNDADLRSSVGTKILLLPNLAPGERRLFNFDFAYQIGSGGRRELSLVLDFVYLVDDREVIASERAFLALSVLEPTPTPTPTATPTPTETPPATASPPASPPEPSATTPPSAIQDPGLPQLTITNAEGANIRSGPSTDYPIIANGLPGQSFVVVGKNTDATWWRVDTSTGLGWIWGSLASVQNVEDINLIVDVPLPTPTPVPTATPTPLGEVSAGGAGSHDALRDALAVEFEEVPVHVQPGQTFRMTLVVHNISNTKVMAVVATFNQDGISPIVPIGVGTHWFLGDIPAGDKKAITNQFYVREDTEPKIQMIEVSVGYRGAEDPVEGKVYMLVESAAPATSMSATPTPDSTASPPPPEDPLWWRILRALFGAGDP